LIINPRVAIEKGWLVGEISEEQIQPNGVDFRVQSVTKIYGRALIGVKETKMYDDGYLLKPDAKNRYWIEPASAYEILSDMEIKMPANVVAQIIIRSSYARNGLFLTTGLFDSGYVGKIGATLHNMAVVAQIEQNARIGQVVFHEAQSSHLYDGQWQTKTTT